jgi:hypothetical protein
MSDFWTVNKRIQAINLDELKMQAVEAEAGRILTLNKEQLNKGETWKGSKIKPKYKSPYYSRKKNKLNSVPGLGVPDINLSGKLQNRMNISFQNNATYSIWSFVDYAAFVLPRYLNILGLSDKNEEKIQPFTTARLGQLFKKEAGL